MKPILGNETRVPLAIRCLSAEAVRDGNCWRIEPAELAVSKSNEFRHLRDLRAAVRKANAQSRAIREAVRSTISDKGMSQARLACLSGLTQPRISDYLSGRRDLTGETLDRVLAVLGIVLK